MESIGNTTDGFLETAYDWRRRTTTLFRAVCAGVTLTAGALPFAATAGDADARFDAGWRPGKFYCLFGGETDKINRYCSRMYFGVEGELQAINRSVIEKLPPKAKCTDHAAAVLAEIRKVPDLAGEMIWSCPSLARNGTCHVSVLVTDPAGSKWVLDNGSVLNRSVGVIGVASLRTFSAELRGEYWLGKPPNDIDVAMGSFEMFDDSDVPRKRNRNPDSRRPRSSDARQKHHVQPQHARKIQ